MLHLGVSCFRVVPWRAGVPTAGPWPVAMSRCRACVKYDMARTVVFVLPQARDVGVPLVSRTPEALVEKARRSNSERI